ncbi:MAG: KamA family radical SAM protein [Spirochaetaceae bacterium]
MLSRAILCARTACMSFPERVTEYYRRLADGPGGEAIRRQFESSAAETAVSRWELGDPLGESRYAVTSRLVHRYRDRALLLATDRCFVHCRHCLRRHFTGREDRHITGEELEAAAAYIDGHPAVREVIISGGDALTIPTHRLGGLVARLRANRPDLILRLATRAAAVAPARVDEECAKLLGSRQPLWLVSQFNHPAELTRESTAALDRLAARGVPLVNQTVLLAGVNDEVGVLEDLFRGLIARRVKPYYLFQGDLARGTSHFRVPIGRGVEIVTELRRRLSGLAMPTYAVDLPGGGGKVPLTESYFETEEPEAYVFRSIEGELYRYPKEADLAAEDR